MGEVLKKFGRYFLLDHIAQGGMAEIYRARLASVDGAGRLIVIKRIMAGFASNTEFLQMFKSEIKVTMGFNHPNIVQLYDFGEENDQPYIAMEFVDGKNLRQYLSRFGEMKQAFPTELAAYIIEQAASGLHYAHSFKDKMTGKPLNIVHRDISPQNILCSFEGGVKVIDFGIAKAQDVGESTRAGVIKGKPSYLSPEQISGDPLDGRCDIFALGIVLWELLVGRKLFSGDNDLAVLKQIEACATHVKPPSTYNPKVPKELDYIVLKALAKNRDKRFQNGEELQRALHKFLYQAFPDFNPGDLSYVAKELFKGEIVEDRKRLQKLNDKVEQLIAADIPALDTTDTGGLELDTAAGPAAAGPGKKEKDTSTLTAAESSTRLVEQPKPGAKEMKIEMEAAPQLRGSTQATRRPPPASLGSTSVAGSGAGYTRSAGSASTQNQQRAQQQQRSQQQQQVPQRASGGDKSFTKFVLLAAAGLAAATFFGPELGIKVPILSDMLAAQTGEAVLVLQGEAKGVSIVVNGKRYGSNLPANINGLPVGMPFQVQVSGPAGTFTQELSLRKGERKSVDVILSPANMPTTADAPTAAAGKTIVLRLLVSPGGATLTVNGRPVDAANPVMEVALDSPLELVADRPGFKPFRREFVLESRQVSGMKEWPMDVQLEPTRFGLLTLRTTPQADATFMIDGKPWVKKTPMENEKVPVGNYSIRLHNEVLGMEKTIQVNVNEGKIVTMDERLEVVNTPRNPAGSQ